MITFPTRANQKFTSSWSVFVPLACYTRPWHIVACKSTHALATDSGPPGNCVNKTGTRLHIAPRVTIKWKQFVFSILMFVSVPLTRYPGSSSATCNAIQIRLETLSQSLLNHSDGIHVKIRINTRRFTATERLSSKKDDIDLGLGTVLAHKFAQFFKLLCIHCTL